MTDPAFVFLWEEGELTNKRVARCAKESLIHGPMGGDIDGTWYESFLRVRKKEKKLRYVRTSCAVYLSCVLDWSGWDLPDWDERAVANGEWGIFTWIGLDFSHPSWIWAEDGVPEEGDFFYRDYSRKTTGDGHVGFFTEGQDEFWLTAEGGGSPEPEETKGLSKSQIERTNGTMCRLAKEPKNIRKLDRQGRKYIGWWRTKLLYLPVDISRMPKE